MNKEFIPYEQALALKELGFDEPCFGCYFHNNKDVVEYNPDGILLNHNNRNSRISAPLYQQAFRWFREKYELFSCIMTEYSYGGNISAYHINGLHQSNISKGDFYNYEEAELACLKKLIEIVKGGQDES
jgi:hypothetical protein